MPTARSGWPRPRPAGAPIGYAGLAAPDLPTETAAGDIELKRIYVLHPYLGSEVAPALMGAVAAHAEARGMRRLLLGVKDDNRRAIAFYFKQGFARIGVRRFQVGATFYDDLILARSL